MDRQIVYPGQILPETSLLQMAKDAMIGVAKLSAAMLGTSTMANGFAVTPTGPASLQVLCAPGEIYSLTSIDALAFSTLPADTTHSIMKQGILLDGVTLSCPAPGTTGQSINYLVQVTYQDSDSTPVLLPYYNSANPAMPYSGMGNNGLTQNTNRKGIAVVSVKAGASAVTGSQVTPAPDAGYIGLYVVTVAFGQTTITAGSITQYSGAPLLPAGLLQSMQSGQTLSANDIGVANAYAANFTPAITALTDKMRVCIKVTNPNTTASTFTPAPGVIAAAAIVGAGHAALQGGEMVATGDAWLQWNSSIGGGSWVMTDSTGGSQQVAAATKTLHAVQFGQIPAHGQCRLAKSGANLVLSPYNGNKLIINGVMQAIPSAGVSLAATSLTPSTLYYIYAYMSSGVMTLEASVTGHSADAATGVEIKTGDATRTLVGMGRPITGPAWQDSTQQRFVLSYFNRANRVAQAVFTSNVSTSSSAFVELSSSIRCEFLTWGDEAVACSIDGATTPSSSTSTATWCGISVDGGPPEDGAVAASSQLSGNSSPIAVTFSRALAEGYHYSTVMLLVTSGISVTMFGAASGPQRTALYTSFRG